MKGQFAPKAIVLEASGIGSVKKNVEVQSDFNKKQIDSAFKDIDSLKEKSRNMVAIAEQIKSKLARKELNVESDEMKAIQEVMFGMGISGATDFSS